MSDPAKAVFLSYASQDAEAAKRLCEALRAAGVEVWFDTDGGLEHGDEWDAKIRRQIKECVLFLPLVSANTQAREEGYFRIEWELAAQRALGIASGVAFILPVVIDDTREPTALVPDRFRAVQWTRLPGGNVPADVLQRFLKLWSHRTGMVKHQSKEQGSSFAKASEDRAGSSELEAGRPLPAAPGPSRPKWLRPILASAVIVISVLAITLFKQRRPETFTAAPGPATATVPAAPLSEARQLTERALKLRRRNALATEELMAAEEMCTRALALDPLDAEVWSAASMVDTQFVITEFDRSEARRQQAQKRAAHAIALAPDSFNARWAQALALAYAGSAPGLRVEAEKIFRALMRENAATANHDFLVDFGTLLRETGQFAEAAALFERMGDLQSAGWNYFVAHDADAAERIADRMLATERTSGALLLKAFVVAVLREDIAGTQAVVGQFTPTELLEAGPLRVALYVAVNNHQTDRAIALVGAYPQDFILASGTAQPKRYFSGLAHELAGRPAAARAEWQVALQQVSERLKTRPNDRDMMSAHALLLACLGEKTDAEREYQLLRNLSAAGDERFDDWWIGLRLGQTEEALAALTKVLEGKERSWQFAHFSARTYVQWAPLRDDPRLKQLLRDTLPPGARPFDDAQGRPFDDSKPGTLNPKPSSPLPVDSKSVAVLAFANLSDDKANEYFSDGISEELLNVLAKVPGLKVTARTSSFHFKGKDTSIPEIAQQLGVAYVVEGSVRKSGDKVRITAQLIKATDGFHLWSETFTRDLKDVFAVQDEIAGLIAKNLELKMDGAVRAGMTVDPEAYRLYLEGRQILQRRTLEGYTRAEKLFAEARTRAPDWAPVYAGLADVARLRAFSTESGPTGPDAPWLPTMKEAKTLADRALELDPTLAEAYVSLAGTNMLAWNFPETERLIHRALELNPNQADAYLVLGRLMAAEGRMDESIAALRRSVDLNPLAPRILDNLAAELGFIGRYEEAWAIIERANALQPDSTQIQCYRVRFLADMGRREEALALARRMVENPNPEEREFRLLEVARVYAMFGMKAEAEAAAAQIPANVPERVIVLAYLGTPEKAVPLLDQLTFGWVEDLLWGRSFDPIRQDPGYVAYLARTGLTESNARAQAWRAAHPPEKPEAKP